MQKKNKKGFTIVELVVVIAVIGILSAILIPTFMGLSDNARKQAIQSDLSAIYTAYAVEAADGEIDLDVAATTGDNPVAAHKETYQIAILGQHDVVVNYPKGSTSYYQFNDKNVWVVADGFVPASKGLIYSKTTADTFLIMDDFGGAGEPVYPTFESYFVYRA